VAGADYAPEVRVDHALLFDAERAQKVFEFLQDGDVLCIAVHQLVFVQMVLYQSKTLLSEFVRELGDLLLFTVHHRGFVAQFVDHCACLPVVFAFGSLQVALNAVADLQHFLVLDFREFFELTDAPLIIDFAWMQLLNVRSQEISRVRVDFSEFFDFSVELGFVGVANDLLELVSPVVAHQVLHPLVQLVEGRIRDDENLFVVLFAVVEDLFDQVVGFYLYFSVGHDRLVQNTGSVGVLDCSVQVFKDVLSVVGQGLLVELVDHIGSESRHRQGEQVVQRFQIAFLVVDAQESVYLSLADAFVV